MILHVKFGSMYIYTVAPKIRTLHEIVHLAMKICFTHPQNIQDVDELDFSSDLEKCLIASPAHQWFLCSEWVPSEWETKQLIKTSQ